MTPEVARLLKDPFELMKVLWPHEQFYGKQEEIVRSVFFEADETVVPACNMSGKDYVAGFIVPVFFLTHWPCRIITTSVKDDHLRVLWGEIGRWVQNARTDTALGPLDSKDGGPLIINHRDMRRLMGGKVCPISYVRGMVSERGEGMAGHHAKYTLAVIDEASGVDDQVYTQMCTWARRILIIGNPNRCVSGKQHFFYKAVKGGDLAAKPLGQVG